MRPFGPSSIPPRGRVGRAYHVAGQPVHPWRRADLSPLHVNNLVGLLSRQAGV